MTPIEALQMAMQELRQLAADDFWWQDDAIDVEVDESAT